MEICVGADPVLCSPPNENRVGWGSLRIAAVSKNQGGKGGPASQSDSMVRYVRELQQHSATWRRQ